MEFNDDQTVVKEGQTWTPATWQVHVPRREAQSQRHMSSSESTRLMQVMMCWQLNRLLED